MAGIAKKLVGNALGVVVVARNAVRHAGWYLRYRMDGEAHDEES